MKWNNISSNQVIWCISWGECCCSVQTFELGDTSVACSDLARVGYQMLYQHNWLGLGVIHHLYSSIYWSELIY